jgi:hypothetical protein
MNPKVFFGELKRHNVYKVGVAYAVIAWLLMQVASQILPFLDNHDGGMLGLAVEPLLRDLRDDARYKNFLAKLGLPTTS